MKYIIKKITLALIAIIAFSCTKDNPETNSETAVVPETTVKFTATIGTEKFSTNDVTLITISAGNTQGFYTAVTNGKSFSSAIFPDQFPVGVAKSIAYSSSISYKLGDVSYIPKSGTMTLSVMDPYKRMKGTFNGVFVGGGGSSEITISGEFDISK